MKSTELKRGQKAIVLSFGKGKGFERKMFEIGIMQGTQIKLLEKHPFRGPLLFQVGNTRIVLGRGIAASLDVSLLEQSE